METYSSGLNGMDISGYFNEAGNGFDISDNQSTSKWIDSSRGNNSEDDVYTNHEGEDYSDYYAYDEYGQYIGHNESSLGYENSILASHYMYTVYKFEFWVLGGLYPSLVLLTLLTNALVISVFMSGKSRGKVTNVLFVSIAISDTLTGIVLLPNAFYIYAGRRYFVTKQFCNFAMLTRFYLSRVFHTVSIWQTVLLGIQRFLCVCHPFISSRICTFWKTICVIGVLYVCALSLHAFHLTNEKIWARQCIWHIESPCRESCVYMWFSVVVQHLVPVFLLIFLTVRTVFTLKKTSRRVSVSSRTSMMQRISRDRLISITVTLIVIVFLVPELPHGLFKLALLVFMHRGDKHVDLRTNHIVFAVYEIVLVFSFHLNFWIYCIMMRDFRRRIISILTLRYLRKKGDNERHMSTGSSSSQKGISFRSSRLSRTNSDAKSRNRIRSSSVSQNAIVRKALTRTLSADSFRNRTLTRNVSLLSTEESDKQGGVAKPPPDHVGQLEMVLANNLPRSDETNLFPSLMEPSGNGERFGTGPKCLTQISQESAYMSWDANEEDEVFL